MGVALRALAAALQALPQQLHINAGSCAAAAIVAPAGTADGTADGTAATAVPDGRWLAVSRVLRAAHADSDECAALRPRLQP